MENIIIQQKFRQLTRTASREETSELWLQWELYSVFEARRERRHENRFR